MSETPGSKYAKQAARIAERVRELESALSSATAEIERLKARREDEGLRFAFDVLSRCGWWSDQRSQFEVSEKALILAIGGVMKEYAEPIEALMKAWRKESP